MLQPEAKMRVTLSDRRVSAPVPSTLLMFADDVARAVTAVRPDMACQSTSAALHLRSPSGHVWTQDLSQIYEIYVGEPGLHASLVRLTVASICDRATLSSAYTAPALEHLLPVVRRRDVLADSDVLFQPFGRSLAQTFVLDHPSGQTLVTAAVQERLTSDLADLQSAARDNLNRRLDEVSVDRLGSGVSVIGSDTLPASSVLFSDVFWRAARLTGDPLFAIPSDVHTLVVFEGRDAKVRDRAMATALEVMHASAQPLTTEIVAVDDIRRL
jgi:hypothetical protein